MKTLELEKMEKLQGGDEVCGFSVAMAAIVFAAGVATGGLGLLIGFAGAMTMTTSGCDR